MSASARSPFRFRSFRLLLAGQSLSSIGDQFYLVALPIALLATPSGAGRGATILGTVLAGFGVARAVTLPLGGWLADRVGSRRLMLFADVGRAVAIAWLAVLIATPAPAISALIAAAVLLGVGDGLFGPASFAILPVLVPDDVLQTANSTYQATGQAIAAAGPIAGGLIVAAVDPSIALAADSASFLLSSLSLLLINHHRNRRATDGAAAGAGAPSSPTGDQPTAQTAPGPRNLWQLWNASPLLRTLLAAAVVTSFVFGGATEVVIPALATGPLRAGASGYGIMLAGLSAGTVAGALLAAKLGRRNSGTTAVVSLAVFGLAIAAISFTPRLPAPLGVTAAVVLLVVAGAGLGAGNTLLMTILQLSLPTQILGRAMSLMLFANLGLFPVSTAVAGFLVSATGPQPLLLYAGILLAAATLATLSAHSLRNATLAPAAAADNNAP